MIKKCYICGKLGKISHLKRAICQKCFVRVVEKRVGKSLGKVFSKGDKVLIVGELAFYLVKNLIKGLPIKIERRRSSDRAKYDWVVREETMDDEVGGFLDVFFKKDLKTRKFKNKFSGAKKSKGFLAQENPKDFLCVDKVKNDKENLQTRKNALHFLCPRNLKEISMTLSTIKKTNKKIIKILRSITDEEAELYAKIKGIKFKVREKNNFLNKISKDHPEFKFGLGRSVKELNLI